jgi:RimJ/RimL family protein N-acetyltransferase
MSLELNIMLNGEQVCLRQIRQEDSQLVGKWSSDPEIMRLTGMVKPLSPADAENHVRNIRGDAGRLWFIIVLKEDGRAVGETGLLRICPPWRTADMTVIIGEKDAWGKGYGTEAGRLLMEYAFNTLRLHRLAIGVAGFNSRALDFWRDLGFKKEGVHRDGYFCDGEFHDFVMMSILEDEYQTP